MARPNPDDRAGSEHPLSRLWIPLALVLVAWAWRHQLGFWFTDTDTLADVVVARVRSPGELLDQLFLPLTGGYGGLNANFYRPLTMLHFALQRALFGWEAGGWHAWDLGLHLASLGTFAAVLRRLGGSRAEAGVFVLIAGLHPVCAEVVPAIARNIDLLCALLVGLSLLAVTRSRPLVASLVAVLALCCKEPAITALPVVVGLWWWRHGLERMAWLVAPWLVLVPGFLAVRAHVLSGVGGYNPDDVLKPHGLWHVLRAGGLDALVTPWAVGLSETFGRSEPVQYGLGMAALLVLGGLCALAARRAPVVAVLAAGLWLGPLTLMGVTASYTRRLLYQPTLAVGLVLAALAVRGGRVGRLAALPVLLALAPGTPLWRPYLDWGVGAEVNRESSVGLEAELAAWVAAHPGERLWLADRPLRFNLDERRAKFWQRGRTLNHGMGRYSLQAWLDERFGEAAPEALSLVACNVPVPLGAATAVLDDDGRIRLSRPGWRRIQGTQGKQLGWRFEAHDDGSMTLTAPEQLTGEAVLVYGAPATLIEL